MHRRLYILLICAALLPVGALAQARQIPAEAKRGTISSLLGGTAVVDGAQAPLSAAVQIRGKGNLIIVPASFPPDSLVKYTLNAAGQLHRIWILTAEEAAAPDPPSGAR